MSNKRGIDEISFTSEEERCFINLDSVSSHLFCSICQEVFYKPYRAPCGHSYCKKCIYSWLKKSKTCPEDRKPLHIGELHHDFIVDNIVGDLQACCPFRQDGCPYVGFLNAQKTHIKNCCFNPINVPDCIRQSPLPVKIRKLDDSVIGLYSPTSSYKYSPPHPSLRMRMFVKEQNKDMLLLMMDQQNQRHRRQLSAPASSTITRAEYLSLDNS